MNLPTMAALPASVVIGTIALAPLVRRLTGARVRFVRYAVAIAIGIFVVRAAAAHGGFTLVHIGVTLALALCLVLLAELLVPSRSAGGVLHQLRSLHLRMLCLRRYLQIGVIACRHVVSAFLANRRVAVADLSAGRTRRARSLRMAIEESGVAFVKLGQLPSVRNQFLPEEYIVELNRLQYQVTPAPWPDVAALLTAELGAAPETVFAEFDPVPLAAASIAQVHRARLRTGHEVAVKIQRPGIRPVIERDLRIIRNLARVLQVRTRFGRSMRTVELAEGFAAALHDELDFRIEARNMVTIGANEARGGTGVRVPRQHSELCTRRVIVMELLDGVPLAAAEPAIAERGLDRVELARTLLRCLFRQLMVDGVFHVDPHAGNVYLLASNGLGLIDFGCVGRLGRGARLDLSRLFLAVEREDADAFRDAILKCLDTTDEVDEQRLAHDLEQFLNRYFRSGLPVEPQVFTDLLRLATRHGLSPSCEFAAVFRALITLCDTINQLAPDFDMFAEVRAFATSHLRWQVGMEAVRQAGGNLLALLPELWRMPANLGRLASMSDSGKSELTVPSRRTARVSGGHREHHVAVVLLLVIAGIIGLLTFAGDGLAIGLNVDLSYVFGFTLLAAAVTLLLRALVAVFVNRDESYPDER